MRALNPLIWIPVLSVIIVASTGCSFYLTSPYMIYFGDADTIDSKLEIMTRTRKEKTESIDDLSKASLSTSTSTAIATATATASNSSPVTTISMKQKSTSPSLVEHELELYKHDFTYDRESWDRNSPRIAVLVGPHKTASTTLQDFFAKVAGFTVSLTMNATETNSSTTFQKPHPTITEWVWPLGMKEDFGFKKMSSQKFYAPLASLISGRNTGFFLGNESPAKVVDYFRSLFRRPWEEGKNLVIGAEAFDTLVQDLSKDTSIVSDAGENTHVSAKSSIMIDALLDIFPWDNSTTSSSDANANSNGNANTNARTPSLRLEDIEVHINHRTTRISHMISLWHQNGHGFTLRHFLMTDNELYWLNSLALALQFVRRDIKTTIIDMAGVFQKESKSTTESTRDEAVVGGLQGVVACDILRMGKNNGACDDNSKLHLPGYKQRKVLDMNKRDDKNVQNLTDEQLKEINRVLEEYDCGVWQHLKKYQAKGTLRILYPMEDLFASCNPKGSRDISFMDTLKKVRNIASRPNGIPRNNQRISKESKKKEKKRSKGSKVSNIRKDDENNRDGR